MSAARATGDHFSSVSTLYAAFRPTYPPELFSYVASLVSRRGRAWDCGAGSGQASAALAESFDEVIASDVSAEQVEQATPNPKVRWLVAAAESTPIESASVDLIAVAQALHWFDHARFYDEVCRVAAPGAAIAAWTYAAPLIEGAPGGVLYRLMFDTLGAFWPPGRHYVDQSYRTIPFPFERLPTPDLHLERAWSVDQVAGYMRSWSATARYIAATGVDPVVDAERALRAAWGNDGTTRRIVWPLAIVAGRVRS